MKIDKANSTYMQQNVKNIEKNMENTKVQEKNIENVKNQEKTIEIKKQNVSLDKINEIKKQITEGTYKINPDVISEKILQDKNLLKKLMD